MSRRLHLCRSILLAIGITITPQLFAQTTPAPTLPTDGTTAPAYDVASIKPNNSGRWSFSSDTNRDSFSATNVSVKMLLVRAYRLKGKHLIFGGPRWIDSERFDIRAKITDRDAEALKNITHEQRRAMLQQLLVDRFHLEMHMETKVLPVYEIVLLKSGPKFKEVTPDGKKTKFNGVSSGGMSIHTSGTMSTVNSQLTAHDVTLSTLADSLSDQLDRTVLDKTGLTGKYDLSLTWTPDDAPDNSPESSATSIFTAVQEQLGLKLRSAKGPVETLVIDHIEMPSEN